MDQYHRILQVSSLIQGIQSFINDLITKQKQCNKDEPLMSIKDDVIQIIYHFRASLHFNELQTKKKSIALEYYFEQ